MPNKFSRTEIIGGEHHVSLFATGYKAIERTIELLEELMMNNSSSEAIAGPADLAISGLYEVLRQVKKPKTRINVAADEAA